jgi:sulfofructose kinase
MTANREPKILCAGIAGQDIVMRVERFPTPGAKVPATELVITGGGCAVNAALAVTALGGRAAFAGPLGSAGDAAGDLVLAQLAAAGVDCSGVVRPEGGAFPVSLILVDAEGEKTVVTRREIKLDDVAPQLPCALPADVDAVLVDNQLPRFVTPIVKAGRERDIPVIVDFDRVAPVDDALLKLGTHVIASSEALRGSTGSGDLARGLAIMAEGCPGVLAVTDGPNGVYWLDDGALQHAPAFAVEVVDSLAAGDVFHAAFAMALAQGRALGAALRFAGAAAALKCTRFGGAAVAPSRAEVDAFLKSRGD